MKPAINILSTKVLSDGFFILENVHFEINNNEKTFEQQREVYNSKNGATVLLYNKQQQTVILTRQLRIATHLNGNDGGMMIEACAGLIDNNDSAEETITREIEEETGYHIERVEKLFALYSSPGATTEQLHYFVAEYNEENKVHEGGGLDEEEENIEVLELSFNDAYNMIKTGEIVDAKTIILLQHAKQFIFTE
jgi:GDP-mannose pyrophosphatase NudK